MRKKLVSMVLCISMAAALTGCGGAAESTESSTKDAAAGSAETTETADAAASGSGAEYAADASLKLWGSQEDQAYLSEVIEMFKQDYPEAAGWNIELAVVGSADAKTEVLKDPTTAADVFEFASDQLSSLVDAGVLYKITKDKDTVEAEMIDTAYQASCINGDLYGYPSTSNSYFMYYDKSMYPNEEDVASLENMLAADLGSGVTNFAMDLDNGWYTASIFFGAGCTLFGEDGQDPTQCSFNNEQGVLAGKYLLGMCQNPKIGNYDDALLLAGFEGRTLGAAITGTWNADAIRESLGDDFGVTTFPTMTLEDGTVMQPSTIVNFNIYGVNAQTKYPLESMLLANYLTSEKVQQIRFAERNSTPVNKNLVANTELLENSPAVATLAEQTTLASTVQPSISQIANFWSPMEAFGQDCIAGQVNDENMQEKLDTLVTSILAVLAE